MESITTQIPGAFEITSHDLEQLLIGIMFGFGISVLSGLIAWGITIVLRLTRNIMKG